MSTPAKINFKIYQGSTFTEVLRWESSNKKYSPITGITQAAPVVLSSTAHGVPAGWRFRITNVVGMKEINSATDSYYYAKVPTADTIEINSVNSIAYTAYTSGGIIEYNEPIDLVGYTARLQIREKIGSTTFISELTTENGGITIDNVNKTITLSISAADTTLFTFVSAVYSLELISGSLVVPFSAGTISLVKEVTR